jgi:hypothetical protein
VEPASRSAAKDRSAAADHAETEVRYDDAAYKKMKLYIFGVLFILLAAGGIIDAQTPDNALTVKADANACELNSAQVDAIRSTVSQSRLRIFVIFRAGLNTSGGFSLKEKGGTTSTLSTPAAKT